ncbi:histidine kinase dimerization/phosphoacceptor domain -containing protein [Mucilaginibacter aquariorum]|uniref:histidine kinase n=1 Tax=Mucilaginibacter aquariorum TaxID=2967225 RepID=A0ABT1SXL9_9SPHI|nr:histidine kinase dimerization/phosphoacceptor domain -containing protein [Mucilaginibacter aquariorum]MCQ6957007.1 ATP-binding protein [Mucilaginibacter aquariorum]
MAKITTSFILKYSFLVVILFLLVEKVSGQTNTSETVLKNYSSSKKRLLVISTVQYINLLTQNNLDQDSIKLIANRITGQPFLLTYTEGFKNQQSSPGADLINKGKISEATTLLGNQRGEQRIMLLLELATWYLHQPGTLSKHLNSAAYFLELADKLSLSENLQDWQIECRLIRSELWHQRNADQKSQDILSAIIKSPSEDKNALHKIRALTQMATLFQQTDSSKVIYLNDAIKICRKQNFKEKEIELLFNLGLSHLVINGNLLEQDMIQALNIMSRINYRHSLYIQNVLSYAYILQSKNLQALQMAKLGLENMEWSNLKAVAGSFYNRMGSCYWTLNKLDYALYWFKRSISSGTIENRVFWYKSVFFATTLLYTKGNAQQALKLLDSVTRKFPPVTIWEKFQVLSTKSSCYTLMDKSDQADKINMEILDLADRNPTMDSYGELAPTYYEYAGNYISKGNIKKAKLFLKKGMERDGGSIDMKYLRYATLYKIDSLEGNTKGAFENHILYKKFYDSNLAMDQRKKMDELTVKYETEKKDQDIKILKQQKSSQQLELNRNLQIQKLIIAGACLLLIIIALLFKVFKINKSTNKAINKKNQILEHLLHEKEWLLKEVHHRVKNNLHTVMCLLESQAAYLENDALKAVESSQLRIYAMSLIHQKLYQSEDIKTVDMAIYLPEFIGYLKDSLGTGNRIFFELEIEPLKFGVAYAVPLSLIINEAITNAIKYAFPNNEKGIISVKMSRNGKFISMVIADNGIGIAREQLNGTTNSLGLKLINGLVDDIQGKITFKNDKGTHIQILFPEEPMISNA